jgi:hypothetical protein
MESVRQCRGTSFVNWPQAGLIQMSVTLPGLSSVISTLMRRWRTLVKGNMSNSLPGPTGRDNFEADGDAANSNSFLESSRSLPQEELVCCFTLPSQTSVVGSPDILRSLEARRNSKQPRCASHGRQILVCGSRVSHFLVFADSGAAPLETGAARSNHGLQAVLQKC